MTDNVNRRKFWLDVALLTTFVAANFHKLAGDAAHEWIGVVFVPLLVAHLVANWNWSAAVVRRFSRSTGFARFLFCWDVLIYALLAGTVLSGVLISRDFLPRLGVSIPNDAYMSFLHKRLAEWLPVAFGIHLGVHYRWLAAVLRRKDAKPEGSAADSAQVARLAETTQTSETSQPAELNASTAVEPNAVKPNAVKPNAVEPNAACRTTRRAFVVLAIGAVLAGGFVAFGKTGKADAIRAEVAKRRAARRARAEAEAAKKRGAAPGGDAANGERKPGEKSDAPRRKGPPGPKPPTVNAKAFAQGGTYFAHFAGFAVAASAILAYKRRTRKASRGESK